MMKNNIIYVNFQTKTRYKLKPKITLSLVIFHLKNIFRTKNKEIPPKVQIYNFRNLL